MSAPITGETSLYKVVQSLRNLWERTRALGEAIAASVVQGSAVSLTSTVNANVTSISLPPGEWDVFGSVLFSPAGTTNITTTVGSISTTSATLDVTPGRVAIVRDAGGFVPSDIFGGAAIGPVRFSFTAQTTVYLVARADFSVSTCAAYGAIRAHRARIAQ